MRSAVRHGVEVLAVFGELDIQEAARLRQAMHETPGPLVVDLRSCAFMGGEGLSALLVARRESIERRRRLVVLIASGGAIARLFEVTGMRTVLTVYEDDLEGAVTAASAVDRRQGPDRRTIQPA